ncbi:hypothetical protein [Vannielia litorea]|uniref:hypothetical protein n=1 Tax=Vannielia litorea TaxID=1217970 RepID=UPI001C947A10|nr:hypothetical protein [Vannielia litorea]MBY6046525.1 hypothetical protein [Vannielia litorea]MBY6073938.1 hypothetical protein [Vannielia litorea]
MSYDLSLYLRRAAAPFASFSGPGWQVVGHGPLSLEDEDIPPEHLAVIGARRQLWQIHIEGAAPPEALDRLQALLDAALTDHKAVLVDEQTGSYQTSRESGPLLPAQPESEAAPPLGPSLRLYFSAPVPPPIATTLPYALQGKGWAFRFEGPRLLTSDQIPEAHRAAAGGRQHMWQVTVEGALDAHRQDRLEVLLASVLHTHDAVLIDEAAERFVTALDSGPLASAARLVQQQPGELSFFFEDANAFHPSRAAAFLSALAEHLPQALPRRFGPWEPLQGKVEGRDLSELARAWEDTPDLLLKAATPFGHIFCSLLTTKALEGYHPNHFIRRDCVVGRIAFELRPKAFTDPALIEAIIAFMPHAAEITGAFYAELRQGECPQRSWFWRGLPPGPARALLLGPPYTALWPEAAALGTELSGGRLLLRTRPGQPELPEPPAALLMPPPAPFGSPARNETAATFPFPPPATA